MASALRNMVTGRKKSQSSVALNDLLTTAPGQNGALQGLSGTLRVTILRAERLPLEKRHSGSLHCDPYVELTVTGAQAAPQIQRTVPRKKTICPEWNQQLIFNQVENADDLIIRVKDKSKTRRVKDWLAQTSLDLHVLIDGSQRVLELPLDPEGTLHMTAVFQDASNLFGLPLVDVCRREQRSIPHLVTKCVEEINRRGIDEKGIYRTGGNARVTEQLKQAFIHQAEEADVTEASAPTIASVASLLKQYLRALPEPLITAALYPAFMQAAGAQETQDHRLRFLQGTIESMPKQHRDCFKYLFDHFYQVVCNSDLNLMTPGALATCLGPTLFTLAENDRLALDHSDVHRQNAITQFLLEHWEDIREAIEPPSLPPSPKQTGAHPTHPRAITVRNDSIRSRRSIDRGEALVSPTSKSLHAIAKHVLQTSQKRRKKTVSGVLAPEEVADLCAQLDITNVAPGQSLTIDEFHAMFDQAVMDEFKVTAKVRASSVAKMQQRWEHHTEREAEYVTKAASSFRRFAETAPDRLTGEEFSALCFDLGLFIANDLAFKSLSKQSQFVTKQTFLQWWKVSGRFLAPVYANNSSRRLLTQFIAFWQYLDGSSNGTLTTTEFTMLHADLRSHNYANLPTSPMLAMKLIQAGVTEPTPSMLSDDPPQPTVTFNRTLRWLVAMNAFDKGETPLDTAPPTLV
eukprot:TRINITY_DN10829_c0_g1_i2.p1 TRINITY_DN10829_c0_g1~~TRINITY_DN10829_c0_g1_i2.p1  ORF type:complete len:687 (+),score=138.30 TRINITY_DN10829_c0_g1_i2:119-2179(+)